MRGPSAILRRIKPSSPPPTWLNTTTTSRPLLEQGKNAEAEAAYRKANGLDPSVPEYHNNFGNSLSKQKKLVEPEAAYREAVKLDPNWAAAKVWVTSWKSRAGSKRPRPNIGPRSSSTRTTPPSRRTFNGYFRRNNEGAPSMIRRSIEIIAFERERIVRRLRRRCASLPRVEGDVDGHAHAGQNFGGGLTTTLSVPDVNNVETHQHEHTPSAVRRRLEMREKYPGRLRGSVLCRKHLLLFALLALFASPLLGCKSLSNQTNEDPNYQPPAKPDLPFDPDLGPRRELFPLPFADKSAFAPDG
ncbi:MAG TPA: hypothetical protein VES88_16550, partial [Gemmatimonadaceae bacterium]|nr:hypothetical protein [Gemmatimonadaceae bacterium]